MAVFDAVTVALKTDQDGVIRVGDTRVRLDTVVSAFNDGQTAEEIVVSYSNLLVTLQNWYFPIIILPSNYT